MPSDFECEHTIQEWQVRSIEGGIVNVGQAWQSGVHRAPADMQSAAIAPSTTVPPQAFSRNHEEGTSAGHVALHPLPTDLNQLVAQVQWLQHRVDELERMHHPGCPKHAPTMPQRVEFKIQKLYVRELSGTLNIGVTSIHDGPIAWSAPTANVPNDDPEDWQRLEQEGDEDWFTDITP